MQNTYYCTFGKIVIFVFFAFSGSGCDVGNNSDGAGSIGSMVPVEMNKAALERLGALNVVFAHQSVGGNILQGIEELAREIGVGVPIESARKVRASAGVKHFLVGENGQPHGKISEFKSFFDKKGEIKDVDIAVLKLCYIDFDANTNTEELAETYIEAIQELQAKYPNIVFVGVTAPLTTTQAGWKAFVKRLLGRDPAGYKENTKRFEFNRVLRSRLARNRLFDIAEIESGSNGSASPSVSGALESLLPEYTEDGGHLNGLGRRVVAEKFILFLGSAVPAT